MTDPFSYFHQVFPRSVNSTQKKTCRKLFKDLRETATICIIFIVVVWHSTLCWWIHLVCIEWENGKKRITEKLRAFQQASSYDCNLFQCYMAHRAQKIHVVSSVGAVCSRSNFTLEIVWMLILHSTFPRDERCPVHIIEFSIVFFLIIWMTKLVSHCIFLLLPTLLLYIFFPCYRFFSSLLFIVSFGSHDIGCCIKFVRNSAIAWFTHFIQMTLMYDIRRKKAEESERAVTNKEKEREKMLRNSSLSHFLWPFFLRSQLLTLNWLINVVQYSRLPAVKCTTLFPLFSIVLWIESLSRLDAMR